MIRKFWFPPEVEAVRENKNLPILKLMDWVDEDFGHLEEELNNLTDPAREELLNLLIKIRTKAEKWGLDNTLPDYSQYLKHRNP